MCLTHGSDGFHRGCIIEHHTATAIDLNINQTGCQYVSFEITLLSN